MCIRDRFYGMFLAIIVEGAIYYPAKTIINAIKKRDIKKLNYFLDHKEELNENIEKSEKSENIKLGVSKKAIKQIELQTVSYTHLYHHIFIL